MIIHLIGCPGVGKSTVAESISKKAGLYVIREEFEGNPFLEDSWKAILEGRKDPVIAYSQFWFMGQYSKVLRMDPDNCIIDAGAMMGLAYTRALHRLGLIDDMVFLSLEANYLPMIQSGKKFSLVTDVDTIIERMASRNRSFEHGDNENLREYLSVVSDYVYDSGAKSVIADIPPDFIANRIMKELQ